MSPAPTMNEKPKFSCSHGGLMKPFFVNNCSELQSPDCSPLVATPRSPCMLLHALLPSPQLSEPFQNHYCFLLFWLLCPPCCSRITIGLAEGTCTRVQADNQPRGSVISTEIKLWVTDAEVVQSIESRSHDRCRVEKAPPCKKSTRSHGTATLAFSIFTFLCFRCLLGI